MNNSLMHWRAGDRFTYKNRKYGVYGWDRTGLIKCRKIRNYSGEKEIFYLKYKNGMNNEEANIREMSFKYDKYIGKNMEFHALLIEELERTIENKIHAL